MRLHWGGTGEADIRVRFAILAALIAATAVSAAGWQGASAQAALRQDWGKIAKDVLKQQTTGKTSTSLSQADVVSGLKEALQVAAANASTKLSLKDGFFGDDAVRIPLPGALGKAQKQLKPLGLSAPLDDLQLKVNRAAEAAAPQAKTLVIAAVKSMTIEDAMSVLKGGDTAATDFLRARTETQLRAAFRPYFQDALAKSGALASVDGAVRKYGAGLVQTDAKTWLTDNATTGALNGLFYYVAREEQAIRKDPVKRTSEILRRVFGG